MLPRNTPFTTCCRAPPRFSTRSSARSLEDLEAAVLHDLHRRLVAPVAVGQKRELPERRREVLHLGEPRHDVVPAPLVARLADGLGQDRKSTRLNSSPEWISYAVFCLKKKKMNHMMFYYVDNNFYFVFKKECMEKI